MRDPDEAYLLLTKVLLVLGIQTYYIKLLYLADYWATARGNLGEERRTR